MAIFILFFSSRIKPSLVYILLLLLQCVLMVCSSEAIGGGELLLQRKAEEEMVKSQGRRGRIYKKKKKARRSHSREHLFFLCIFKSCLHQPILLGQAAAAEGRHSRRGTGDISTQYLISLPSLMHPGVSSPAPTQADR